MDKIAKTINYLSEAINLHKIRK